MNRNGALFPAAVLVLLSGSLQAEETAVKSRIVSVGLFKNGLAVVNRAVTVDGPGSYRLDDVPEPVHGTYWIESAAQVETQVKMLEVEVPAGTSGDVDLQKELAGRKVTVHFHGGNIPAATGVVVDLKPAKNDEAALAASRLRRGAGYTDDSTPPAPARFLVLQTARGRAYLDSSQIASVESEGQPDKIKQRKPVLELTVDKVEKKPVEIHVTYLARGIAWAPSYRVDISDPKTLSLEQAAVVKNELGNLDNAEIFLISGFPSVQFAHVTSPLSARTTWARFFQELSQRFNPTSDLTSNGIVSQQAVSPSSPLNIDLSATPGGEGVDLHFQSIGKRTLAEGDSLALTVGRGKGTYERIVEWLVPDNRDEFGQQVARERGGDDPDQSHEGAWDALRFRNPLSFPMTTGPAMVVADGRFNGQRTSYWVNPGEETILHVNKALSVRTRSIEQEEQKK
ncbi:MAG TPA: hypothetical protein VG013_10885, partial [Gemmataceae bacterium]|nr:hypothetical protein [Gemmataceae bacterium]